MQSPELSSRLSNGVSVANGRRGSSHYHHHHHEAIDPLDSDDANQGQSDDDDIAIDDSPDAVRTGKRKRPISVSCELCKQRKVKCDRGQPSCGWCSRNGALCEYKERKKPGLRAGYGRELEQRLDKLEEILRTHSEILQASLVANANSVTTNGAVIHANTSSSVRGSNASLPSDQGTPRDGTMSALFSRAAIDRTPQEQTALFLQKPSAFPASTQPPMEFGMAPPTPTIIDGFRPMAGLSPQTTMPPTLPPTAAAQEYYGPAPTQAQTALTSPTVTMNGGQSEISSDKELPQYDLLYALVDLYFRHINTWCPILHRKTTLDSLFGLSVIDEADRILLHAIVATTLRFSTDARLTEERRRHYHDTSKSRVLLYGLENSSVKSLQALVILSLDLIGSSNGPPGWNIMALITRSVVQLGLAVESNSFSVSPNYTSIYTLRAMILSEPRDFVEEESRRRLFWMVYLLDRYATIATAFEFALDDKEIDRTLPCRDDLWMKNQKVETRWFRPDERPGDAVSSSSTAASDFDTMNKPENLGAFSYYIEILGILTKIHKFLKLPVDISSLGDVEEWQLRYKELDNSLTSWKFGLPGEYGNMAKLFQPGSAKMLNSGWVMLHATYHTAVIRLHSSAAYPTTRSPIFTPSYSASQRCHGAVDNIAALGEFVVAQGLLARLGPPFAFTLWVAARVLLVHGSTVEHKVSPQIGFFVDTLREMGHYWPVAARYCQLLGRVLDEHRDSERAADGVTPSSVRILADMRRTAFDLDLLISRQPRFTGGATNGVNGGGANGVNGGMAGMSNGQQGSGGGANGGGGGGGTYSRLTSVTPARTPAPNELEYLDVFDFFNVPRLPFGPANAVGEGMNGSGSNGAGSGAAETNGNSSSEGANGDAGGSGDAASVGGGMVGLGLGVGGNEFNITDFTVDQNRDWFKEDGGGKFLG